MSRFSCWSNNCLDPIRMLHLFALQLFVLFLLVGSKLNTWCVFSDGRCRQPSPGLQQSVRHDHVHGLHPDLQDVRVQGVYLVSVWSGERGAVADDVAFVSRFRADSPPPPQRWTCTASTAAAPAPSACPRPRWPPSAHASPPTTPWGEGPRWTTR